LKAALTTLSVAIYLFDEVEVLDFAGPFEVFATASRVWARSHPGEPKPFEVFTVAVALRPIQAHAGLTVLPAFDLGSHPPIDVLIVPGGVVSAELERPDLIDWIRRTDAATTITASVCTGAFLLAKAGLRDGKPATTHWEDVSDLRATFPAVAVQEGLRWVEDGKVVTSAGISAGIDMSLHLVARLASPELAVRTARQMDYE
jgi:transcriptional regulator GlxA family with amidase domain